MLRLGLRRDTLALPFPAREQGGGRQHIAAYRPSPGRHPKFHSIAEDHPSAQAVNPGPSPRKANRRAPQAVGSYDGSWDAAALGEALLVPPPAARALAVALEEADRLPRNITITEIAKRFAILEQELDLSSTEVARMVALQPALLACPTATLRARAVQLAAGLNRVLTAPTASAAATARPPGATASPEATARAVGPNTLGVAVRRPFAPLPTGTKARDDASARQDQPPAAAPNTGARLDVRTQAAPTASGRSGDTPDTTASSGALVTPAAAIALIARQPALLEAPMDRLCWRSRELAELLGTTPYDACHSLTRLLPNELELVLQAPPPAVQRAVRRLAGAMASLDLPGPVGPAEPAASAHMHAHGDLRNSNGDGGSGGEGGADGHGHGDADSDQYGPVQLRPRHHGRQPRASACAGRDPAAPVVGPSTRRMVLLCPQLLLMPAATVRASALHLQALLRLPLVALRRLLTRSPRLLLLPPRHRLEALRALTAALELPDPRDAARLAAQQPNLLKWTPEGLRGKLAEVGAALDLPPAGIARLCRNQPALLAMSAQSLAAKLGRLQALLHLPDADAARRVALRQPGVLSMSSDTAARKLRQLADGLRLVSGAAGKPPAVQALRGGLRPGSWLAEARRMAAAEPTLLTMDAGALPRRLAALTEALGPATLQEAREAAAACPRLLVVQRAALAHRLQEIAWGLEAPAGAVRALVLAQPRVLFMGLAGLRATVAAVQKKGVGKGLRGRRRVVAALEYLAEEPGALVAGETSDAQRR